MYPREVNPTPEQIHKAEQRHASANLLLDQLLAQFEHDIPTLTEITGLSDGSIVYDYALNVLGNRLMNPFTAQAAMYVSAAAITRLARATREHDMSQFEFEGEAGEGDNR